MQTIEKTKIIASKEIIINLKLLIISILISLVSYGFFYLIFKPDNKRVEHVNLSINNTNTDSTLITVSKENNSNILKEDTTIKSSNTFNKNKKANHKHSQHSIKKITDKEIYELEKAGITPIGKEGTASNITPVNSGGLSMQEGRAQAEVAHKNTMDASLEHIEVNPILIDKPSRYDGIGLSKEDAASYETIIEIRMRNFHNDIFNKAILTFIISLISLIIGRYIYIFAKGVNKYSKMDINQ